MTPSQELPDFVAPMLARLGDAFDSEEHLYEIKWDGIRALTFADKGDYRLTSRNRNDMVARYPELECLARLPAGTILDGEIVALRENKPDFQTVLRREQVRNPRRARELMEILPITYIVFDLLYDGYEPILRRSLLERRERLREIIDALGNERLVFSDGVIAGGIPYFEEACKQGLEGVVAKRLRSRYLPGKRTDSWMKFKRSETAACLIIGYLAEGDDLRSLVIATEQDGKLRSVGRVGSGLDGEMRAHLLGLLRERHRDEPIVATASGGKWVEPGLYCTVSYLERTEGGELRAPVFKGLIEE